MAILCDLETFPAAAKHGVLCVGNFDGVHRGHHRMLSRGRQLASECRCPFVIMTFAIHPLMILTPRSAPTPLSTLDQRMEWLEKFSPDAIILITPNPVFLAMPADLFLQKVVCGIVAARQMVEGPSFTFGQGAAGDIAMLESQHAARGFGLTVVPTALATLADLTEVTVSSSLCRWLISHGRMEDATKLLGRSYTLRAPVVHGAGRGKTLGFPTINLAVAQLIPAIGVYAGQAMVAGQLHPAAISVGTNATFGDGQISVEAFLPDFAGTVYEQTVDLAFGQWIRDQYTFSGPEPLRRRIAVDVQTVRQVFNKGRLAATDSPVYNLATAGLATATPMAAPGPTTSKEQS